MEWPWVWLRQWVFALEKVMVCGVLKGDFNYSVGISSNCARSGCWHPDEAKSSFFLQCWVMTLTVAVTVCRKGKKMSCVYMCVCVVWRDLVLLPFSAVLCFSCGRKSLGCNAPLLVRQSVKPALIWSRCVLRNKEPGFWSHVESGYGSCAFYSCFYSHQLKHLSHNISVTCSIILIHAE